MKLLAMPSPLVRLVLCPDSAKPGGGTHAQTINNPVTVASSKARHVDDNNDDEEEEDLDAILW